MHHIFVYIVRSNQDPFAGIKRMIRNDSAGEILDVSMSPHEFDTIERVEYSFRRFFRFIYYWSIFVKLETRLIETLRSCERDQVNVYFSDEGVWAVVWGRLRERFVGIDIKGINVQHGFAVRREAPYGALRRLINALIIMLTGYPCFGMGSLGGIGAGPFDLYLTYDTSTADFIKDRRGVDAVASPRIIKYELISGYYNRVLSEPASTTAIFAMQPKVKGSLINCGLDETFDQLLELAKTIVKHGWKLRLRLHPGMDRESACSYFNRHPICCWAELDPHHSLHDSLKEASVVLSFYSTVLWEASLLGLTSAQVVCACCQHIELGYERETINLEQALKPQIARLLESSKQHSTSSCQELESMEWQKIRSKLRLDRLYITE